MPDEITPSAPITPEITDQVQEPEETPKEQAQGPTPEQQKQIDEYNAWYEAQVIERLKKEGKLREDEPEPEPEPKQTGKSWEDEHDEWVENIETRAAAKYPVRPGMSEAQKTAAYGKQKAFFTREYSKGIAHVARQSALEQVKNEVFPVINNLTKAFTDISAHEHLKANPHLAEIGDDYRELVEKFGVPLEKINKLIQAGQKMQAAATTKENAPFKVIHRGGVQMTVPSDLAPLYGSTEKEQQKAIDAEWDKLIPLRKKA